MSTCSRRLLVICESESESESESVVTSGDVIITVQCVIVIVQCIVLNNYTQVFLSRVEQNRTDLDM